MIKKHVQIDSVTLFTASHFCYGVKYLFIYPLLYVASGRRLNILEEPAAIYCNMTLFHTIMDIHAHADI